MKRLLLSLGLSVLLAGCLSVSGGKEAGVIDSGTSYAKEALQKFVDSGEMPGAVCVYYDIGVQETSCIGYADVSAKRPITIDDHYMQCSQTKGFCGVTIAILVEEAGRARSLLRDHIVQARAVPPACSRQRDATATHRRCSRRRPRNSAGRTSRTGARIHARQDWW